MKLRRCGRIKYALLSAPCDCFNAIHRCSRNDLHSGDHRCTCEHQWDEWAKASAGGPSPHQAEAGDSQGDAK